jgi:prepilin-type N-terminal cleavage/methylation domain-containing protein
LRYIKTRSIRSFTLVELLIVIAILAVLAAAVVIVLNPAELLAQARDSQRVTDIDSIKSSISLWQIDNIGVSEGSSQTIYLSLPDAASTCTSYALPTLPLGWNYHCVPSADMRKIDGNGWMPINFTTVKGGSPLPYLPIDPVNDAATGRYYTYVPGGSYELTAVMEAKKQNSASLNDGGSLTGVYQVGSHIGLTPPLRDNGLVGYWSFDEGLGGIVYDRSGQGNNGAWSGAGSHYSAGKVGSYTGTFNGVDDLVNCGTGSSLDITNTLTASFWIKGPAANGNYGPILYKYGSSRGWQIQIGGYGPAIYMRVDTSAGTNQCGGSITVLDDTWHHAVYILDNGAIRSYLDGVLTNSATYNPGSGLNASAFSFNIAKYGIFTGYLDDVRLYNRALSVDEIKTIYNTTK